MPPKKGPAGKKGKGKDAKGGKKGKEKMSKKMAKLMKKFGDIMFEGAYVVTMRRDELEFAAEKLKEEVTLQRSERIRYQLERDFLYDLVQLFLARHKELQLRLEAQLGENNKLVQETEEMGIVKGQEAKHFRYEVELRRARMDMADEMRRKNLLAHADRIWQNACASIDEQLDIQEKREADFLREMAETKEELNDLDEHLSTMKEDMKKFSKDCVAKVAQALRDCEMITKMDSMEGEEIMNEMLFSSCKLNDEMFSMIQDYYNDMTMNNLNVIIMMRDRYEELFDHNKFMRGEIERYENGAFRAGKIMRKLKPTYNRARTKHEQNIRLQQGYETTQRGIQMCDVRMGKLKETYDALTKKLAGIVDERNYFQTHTQELSLRVVDSYERRYQLKELRKNMNKSIRIRDTEEANLMQQFSSPTEYYNQIEGYRAEINNRDHALDRYLRKLTLHQWQVAEANLEDFE